MQDTKKSRRPRLLAGGPHEIGHHLKIQNKMMFKIQFSLGGGGCAHKESSPK